MLQQEDLLMENMPQPLEPKISYWAQLGILLGGLGVMMVLASVVGMAIAAAVLHVPLLQVEAALKKVENADVARTLNTVVAFFVLFVPALVWARIMNRAPFQKLGFSKVLSGKQVFLLIFMAFLALMISNVFGVITQYLPLPKSFLEKARAFEKQYNENVAVMANMKNLKDYLVSLFVMAFCPALFEEALFRGGFQQLFIKWAKKPWLGILITSILFSAIHLSYFGFFARTALGMVLGYVFYFSRNLWLNIILHFLNNAIIITIFYKFSMMGKSMEDAEKATNGGDWLTTLLYAPLFVFSLLFMFRHFKKESERILPQETNYQ